MRATVFDIINIVDSIAPGNLAEDWDNIGLQVGKRDWPVAKIWVALDPLAEVVEAACKNKVDLLITHHPLIFKPLTALDFDTPVGSILCMAVEHRMAIFTAHTNLDSAKGGINDVLAEQMDLKNIRGLGEAAVASELLKLVFYLPAEFESNAISFLSETAAADLGITAGRLFRSNLSFKHPAGSHDVPMRKFANGEKEEDLRIEVQVLKSEASGVLRKLKRRLEFEQVSYDMYPLLPPVPQAGLGRIGELSKGSDIMAFARRIKRKLRLPSVRISGDPDLPVYRVAVCSGSGSSLLNAFLTSGAQVYVTGDLRYHDARIAESAGRGLIDIGHFASEHLMVEVLVNMLQSRLTEAGIDVCVEASGLETDPFVII